MLIEPIDVPTKDENPMQSSACPLDLSRTAYSYVERPNPAIQALVTKHLGMKRPNARILDIGCGCGANAGTIRENHPSLSVVGIEPNPRAAELARKACSEVHCGTLDEWRRSPGDKAPFDALILSDVLEHIADPIAFVRDIRTTEALRHAMWIVSVPNYAVWYNRLRTAAGVQSYGWSGLWDRTHLRFFTRRSVRELLEYCGLSVLDESCTPSLVQSAAPVLRKVFERDVAQGDHLALAESNVFRLYREYVEPLEARVCGMWPEMFGFQVVLVATSPS